MNSFERANLQQTDMQSLQSRILSIHKLSLLYPENTEYSDLLSLYKQYVSFTDPSKRILSPFEKKIKKVNRSLNSQLVQESPIITLGTMLRILSVDQSLEKKVQKYGAENVQILSFGAGSDLRFNLAKYSNCGSIVELDFQESIEYKKKTLPAKENINYVACDLTNTAEVLESLKAVIRKNMHTVVLMECLLCYLPIPVADTYIEFFNAEVAAENNAEKLHYVIYDPVSLRENDPFAKIMYENLFTFNNLNLHSLREIHTVQDYVARFNNNALVFKAKSLWEYLEDSENKDQLFRTCLIDEFEELQLLLSHYIILDS